MKRFLLIAFMCAWGCAHAPADAPAPAWDNTEIAPLLINGDPVRDNSFKEVVMLRMNNSSCTGTLVGPRVVVTAAHCVENGGTAQFSINGIRYQGSGMRSPIYPGKDHDIALVILNSPVTGIKYASIGGKAAKGMDITLLGYGCIKPGGGGGNDGILRKGISTIIGSGGYDMISKRPDGAALCYGDSGGPAFVFGPNGEHWLLGVNSKGNIRDTNYNLRTDLTETRNFLVNSASAKGVTICGINDNCTGSAPDDPNPEPEPKPEPKPQPEPKPSCGNWYECFLGWLEGILGLR